MGRSSFSHRCNFVNFSVPRKTKGTSKGRPEGTADLVKPIHRTANAWYAPGVQKQSLVRAAIGSWGDSCGASCGLD